MNKKKGLCDLIFFIILSILLFIFTVFICSIFAKLLGQLENNFSYYFVTFVIGVVSFCSYDTFFKFIKYTICWYCPKCKRIRLTYSDKESIYCCSCNNIIEKESDTDWEHIYDPDAMP